MRSGSDTINIQIYQWRQVIQVVKIECCHDEVELSKATELRSGLVNAILRSWFRGTGLEIG